MLGRADGVKESFGEWIHGLENYCFKEVQSSLGPTCMWPNNFKSLYFKGDD